MSELTPDMLPMRRYRTRQLPAMWDGHPVTWDGWRMLHIRVCHPTTSICPNCGSDLTSAPTNYGRVQDGRLIVTALIAIRCRECGHDQVLDGRGELWDLDGSDYGPDGSWPRPGGVQ